MARPSGIADPAPCPRVINANERAPEGLKRFKVIAADRYPATKRTILARDETEARTHFLAVAGVTGLHADELTVTALAD